MSLCKICFGEVRDGVVVPSWHSGEEGDRAFAHRECLTQRALDFIKEDPLREGLLRYLVEFEESYAPEDWAKDVSAGTADVSWTWDKVGIPAPKIVPLVNAGLLSIIFSSRSSTHYALIGREVIKKVLGDFERLREGASLIATLKILVEREKVASNLACYMSEQAWGVSRDVREAVRIGRICRNRDEVNEDIKLIRRYGPA